MSNKSNSVKYYNQRQVAKTKSMSRTDGWQNVVNGLGRRGYDSKMDTTFKLDMHFPDRFITNLYSGDGIFKKIIQKPVKAMLKNWFKIPQDPDGEILKYLRKLDAKQQLKKAMYYSRLYGGAGIIIGTNNTRNNELEEPLNLNTIQSVVSLTVFPRESLTVFDQYRISDIASPRYGEPELYFVTPK